MGGDVSFCIGEEEVLCYRNCIAALSQPLRTMLYGGFAEAKRETINFSSNGISVEGMRVVDVFSRTGKLNDDLPPNTVLEILAFANKFCCERLKASCDSWLTRLLHGLEEAILLVDYGLEEMAHHLVGACLQVILRELPRSLHDTRVMRFFCTPGGKERLALSGHISFSLYYFLGLVAMEEDIRSNTTVMLLERLGECAAPGWQKQLALHLLGCVMLERNEYEDAQRWFEEAVEEGHLYSKAGLARAKYRRGNRYAAFKMINNLVCENDAVAWMYQERSLYCIGKDEKLRDLNEATKFDPTLSYPYKYRAIILMEENKIEAAIAEIDKIIRFKVSTDCLELRSWFLMARENYEEALRDIRALMTLDPDYLMFHGKVHGNQLVDVLQHHVPQLNLADCWMQLYDRWSAVDDIGSLSIVHHMLAIEPCKGVLRFRQSLLLLRLNCEKAAMRSLRMARNNSLYEHERLVYEGWILYDTGHREEALAKAEESISIQRSFEAFFLKAYALADTLMDRSSSSYVIELLNEALKCPSDGLRKGQALNNLGSVYVDCEKLDKAADCYYSALNIRHTRAHQGLARVYHLRSQRKAAYDEMTRLIEKASNCASAYEKRSEYCDREMAKTDLRRATELDPLRTYPYRYRAAVLMDDNKEYEAIEELTKAISFKPDIQMLHLRAAFFESMGEPSAALRDCEASLAMEPTHSDTMELYQKVSKQVHMH